MGRSKVARRLDVAPMLARIAQAFATDADVGTNTVPSNVTEALIEFAHLASIAVPTRGVIASDEFRNAVDAIGRRHFQRHVADQRFNASVARVANLNDRDAIEVAHIQVLEAGELAHYYAGLACGVTLVDFRRG